MKTGTVILKWQLFKIVVISKSLFKVSVNVS